MDLLVVYAISFLGLPYKWGGNDTIDGMDCSGFVQELLESSGASADPPRDRTSQQLYDYFAEHGSWNKRRVGGLVFYGESNKRITHVAFLIDSYRVIEAAGGGSRTHDRRDAARDDAFIRIRPVNYRKDLRAIIYPDYSSIGIPY